MKLFSILAAVLVAAGALSLTGTTSANGGGHGSGHGGGNGSGHGAGHGSHAGGNAGHGGHGSAGSHGGGGHGVHNGGRPRTFNSWSRYCRFPAYNCYGYYCSCDNTWYYWYGPSDCYLPVSNMATYPPDNSTPPMLPPGATEIR